MNILKLYHARWKQNLFDEKGNVYKNRIVEYFVQYERINHIINQQIEIRNGFNTVTGHIDQIDTVIFSEINNAINQIKNISEFDSVVYEFRPWNDFERIERAWASKRAQGYRFNNLNLNIKNSKSISLATRLRFLDAQKLKNSVINNIPNEISLELDNLVHTLIRADFYSIDNTDKIIQEYWTEKEQTLI